MGIETVYWLGENPTFDQIAGLCSEAVRDAIRFIKEHAVPFEEIEEIRVWPRRWWKGQNAYYLEVLVVPTGRGRSLVSKGAVSVHPRHPQADPGLPTVDELQRRVNYGEMLSDRENTKLASWVYKHGEPEVGGDRRG